MKNAISVRPRANGIDLDGDDFKRQLLNVLASLDEGDFSVRLPADLTGLDGKLADTFNQVAARMERFGENVSRLRNEVGRRGKIANGCRWATPSVNGRIELNPSIRS